MRCVKHTADLPACPQSKCRQNQRFPAITDLDTIMDKALHSRGRGKRKANRIGSPLCLATLSYFSRMTFFVCTLCLSWAESR